MQATSRRQGWALALVLALGVAAPAGAASTHQERLEKAVEALTPSSTTKAKTKGLCVCLSDNDPNGIKRVGVLSKTLFGQNPVRVGLVCFLPSFQPDGNVTPGMPSACDDWAPLGK